MTSGAHPRELSQGDVLELELDGCFWYLHAREDTGPFGTWVRLIGPIAEPMDPSALTTADHEYNLNLAGRVSQRRKAGLRRVGSARLPTGEEGTPTTLHWAKVHGPHGLSDGFSITDRGGAKTELLTLPADRSGMDHGDMLAPGDIAPLIMSGWRPQDWPRTTVLQAIRNGLRLMARDDPERLQPREGADRSSPG